MNHTPLALSSKTLSGSYTLPGCSISTTTNSNLPSRTGSPIPGSGGTVVVVVCSVVVVGSSVVVVSATVVVVASDVAVPSLVVVVASVVVVSTTVVVVATDVVVSDEATSVASSSIGVSATPIISTTKDTPKTIPACFRFVIRRKRMGLIREIAPTMNPTNPINPISAPISGHLRKPIHT